MHNKLLQDRIGRLKEWEQPVNSEKLREILELNKEILEKAEEKGLSIKSILESIQQFLADSEIDGSLIINDIQPLNEILYSSFESIDAYIEQRFNKLTKEIKDEAIFTKDHLEGIINEVNINRKFGAERLNQMAKNIMAEVPFREESPIIKVAVCTLGDVSKQKFLYPVSIDAPIVSKANGYVTKSPRYLGTVFAMCDYFTVLEIMKHTYEVLITTKKGPIKAQACLRYSEKYLQKLEALYNCFNVNELLWSTVNAVYFYKFLDIHITTEIYDEAESFEVDFGNFEGYLSYDKVLLWNVVKMPAAATSYEVKPVYDSIQYELSLEGLDFLENHYLICSVFDKFSCFRRGNILYLRTYKKQPEQIELLRISSSETTDLPLYLPCKTNSKKPIAVNLLATRRYVPTRADAERIVSSLKHETGLELLDVKVVPNDNKNACGYNMLDFNFFMNTNSFLPDRRLLVFSFKSNTEDIWVYETMFYVLSELQLYFYEFRCVGEIL